MKNKPEKTKCGKPAAGTAEKRIAGLIRAGRFLWPKLIVLCPILAAVVKALWRRRKARRKPGPGH